MYKLHGTPPVSIRALKAALPEVPRWTLAEILQTWLKTNEPHPRRLCWTKPGTVWAMDFTQLDRPLADGSRHVLLVRDLASGMMLATTACHHATADAAKAVLGPLMAVHGAPLVLKSENGSHFIAGIVEKMLAARRIIHLRSPPRTPQFNGAIEAGAGLIKRRLSEHELEMDPGCEDDPGCRLSHEDLEHERWRANETSRRGGAGCPTPQDRWLARAPITPQERADFAALVEEHGRLAEAELLAKLLAEGSPRVPGEELDHRGRATVARSSIRRSLLTSGLLEIRNTRNSSGE